MSEINDVPQVGTETKPTQSPELMDSLAAFESVAREIAAVPEDELVAVNVDIMSAVVTVLGTLPAVKRARPGLALLPRFDARQFDNLETYARALGYAHTAHLRNTALPEIAALAQEATQLREALLQDVGVLCRRGLLDAAALDKLKGPVGYRNLAFDLAALSTLLRQAWPQVQNKTAVDASEVKRARAVSDKLITTIGLRERDPQELAETALVRQRAFTLFYKAYDQVRRGVTYLRWEEGDATDIAPSLYERRNKRKNEASEQQEPTPVETTLEPKETASTGAGTTGGRTTGAGSVGVTLSGDLPGGEAFDRN